MATGSLTIGELTYLIERDLGLPTLDLFLEELESGAYTFDAGGGDFSRIRRLVNRYRDLPLGFADASVIAVAERHGGTIPARDYHFNVVAREGRITVLP